MISSHARFGLVVLAAVLAGCGDYSNQDLEFMNALPEGGELRANLPPVPSALALANEAELARSTHDTTRTFNRLAAALVGIVDAIRSYPPTARTANLRVWGPFPADRAKLKNLDWETRMSVTRDQLVEHRFDYDIAVHHLGSPDTDWPVLLRGYFQTGAGHTARRGMGHVELLTAEVRAEGLDVTDLGMLDHLEIDYDTFDDPVTNTMHLTELPDPASSDPAPTAAFTYVANATGRGEMTFDLVGNFIPGPATEDMRVVSDWLATGEGRASLTVVSGDGMGSRQTECWDRSFQATYNDKPWSAGEDVPANPPGAPEALCPAIPGL